VHTASWLEVEEIKALGPLCLVDGSLFRVLVRMSWAVYKKGKNALRLHLALDLNHMIPVEFAIGAGTSSERAFLRSIVQAGLTYVADRGYFAFELFDHIQRAQAYFVMRAKENLQYTISEPFALTGAFPVRWENVSDQQVLLSNDPFQHPYRLVTFSVLGKPFLILTNRFDLTSFQVILIYAYRWQVELIFRFLKQGLRGTHLFSHSSEGSQVFFYLLLITALLQLQLKQGCAIQAAEVTAKKTTPKTTQVTDPDPVETDPQADTSLAPYSFLAAIGAKLNTYWKIGCHWLRKLQNWLAQPFELPIIRALGYD
jgi:transposase